MATSLARQLAVQRQRTAAPSVRGGDARRTRPSLLFERGEAADYDARTIRHLGLSGLEELLTAGGAASALLAFRDALFVGAAAETERQLINSEANDKLNLQLNELLLELGPFMLDKAAHKVLEFLIRHYEVQVHNVDALMRSAIPYHDTQFFARLVAVPIHTDNTRWAFLKQMKKTREPLSRQQLVKVCMAEPAVLRAVVEQVQLQPSNARLVPFFAVLASQTIYEASLGRKTSRSKEDILDTKIVPLLVPAALDAVRDPDHPERQRAGLVLVGQLAKHADLSDKACKLFQLAVLRKADSSTLPEALQCAALVHYFGPHTAEIPDKCVKHLSKHSTPADLAAAMAQAFGADPVSAPAVRFIKSLYIQLAAPGDHLDRRLAALQECVKLCLTPNASALFAKLAALHQRQNEDGLPQADNSLLEAIASTLAARRPASIDAAIHGAQKELCSAFASACFAEEAAHVGSRPVDADGGHTTLRLALHHASPAVRAHALANLCGSLNDFESVDLSVVLDRLCDDDVKVAVGAAKLIEDVLSRNQDLRLSIEDAERLATAVDTSASRQGAPRALLQATLSAVGELRLELDEELDGQREAANSIAMDVVVFALRFLRDSGLAATAIAALATAAEANQTRPVFAAFSSASPLAKSIKQPAALLQAALTAVSSCLASADNEVIAGLAQRAMDRNVTDACISLCLALTGVVGATKLATDRARVFGATAAAVATADCIWGAKENKDSVKLLKAAVLAVVDAAAAKDPTTRQSLLGPAEHAPLSLRMLITFLASPERAQSTLCTPAIQRLLQTCFEACTLHSLLLIAAGAVSRAPPAAQRRALVLCEALVCAGAKQFNFLECTPYLLYPLANKQSAAARCAAVSCAAAVLKTRNAKELYFGLPATAKSAPPKELGPAPKGPGPHLSGYPTMALTFLLERIVEARAEIETDAGAVDRVLRSFSSPEAAAAVQGVLARVAMMVQAMPSQQQQTDAPLEFNVARCAEGILRPVIANAPIPSQGKAACMVARASADKDLPKLLGLATRRWADASAEVDTQVVLDGLDMGPAARHAVLRALQATHVYTRLDEPSKNAAFDSLCRLLSQEGPTTSAQIRNEALKAMAKVPFEGSLLAQRIEKVELDGPQQIVLDAVRARLFEEETSSPEQLLELATSVIPPLCKLLAARNLNLLVLICLNRALSVLLQLVQAKASLASTKAVGHALAGVDLKAVVTCVLTAADPPIRNACLELLTVCTKLLPDQALEAVLPILEAIGQDQDTEEVDETVSPYLFVVLEQLTRCLASASGQAQGGSAKTAAHFARLVDVIAKFVRACRDSSHVTRLLHLLDLLVKSCTSDGSSLWAVVTLLLSSSISDTEIDSDSEDEAMVLASTNNVEQQRWLATNLLGRFPVAEQVVNLTQLVRTLPLFLETPAGAPPAGIKASHRGVDGFIIPLVAAATHGEPFGDARFELVGNMCKVVSEHLGSKTFLRMLRSLSSAQVAAARLEGKDGFLGLLHHLHRLVHQSTKMVEEAEEDEDVTVWVTLRDELCEVLDKCSALLPVPIFVAVVQELLQDQDAHVRHLAIRQLSAKVEQKNARWRGPETLLFLEMVGRLHEILADNDESRVNKQTALLSVDVLARTFGSQHPKPFLAVVKAAAIVLRESVDAIAPPRSAEDVETECETLQLASSAALCIGTLVTVLGAQTLSQLPVFAPNLLRSFKHCLAFEAARGDDEETRPAEADACAMLAQSAASSVFAMVNEVPSFLSPYLEDILVLVGTGSLDGAAPLIQATCDRIGRQLAQQIEPRLLLGPIGKVVTLLLRQGNVLAAENVVEVLDNTLQKMGRSVLAQHLATVADIFVQMLDVRALVAGDSVDLDQQAERELAVAQFETAMCRCYLDLAMQLSASQMKRTFKTLCAAVVPDSEGDIEDGGAKGGDLFGEIEDASASAESGSRGTKRKAEAATGQDWLRQCRVATFYCLVSMIGERLMSLSAPFVTKALSPALVDLQAGVNGLEPMAAASDSDSESDAEDSSASDIDEPARPAKRAKGKGGAAVAVPEAGDGPASLRWRTQQRLVRERALEVVRTLCEHANDGLMDQQGQLTAQFSDVLEGILFGMDISRHALSSSGKGTKEDVEYYHGMVEDHLIPALVQLAKAGGEDVAWQTLQHAVLAFAKHASPEVRVASLRATVSLFEDVGEPYIVLLADTLPTVAELLEDKETMVKLEANKAAKKLQQLSGEDLTTFLK